MNFQPDSHPAILPWGYRFVVRWIRGPLEIGGRVYRRQYVRVVQRFQFSGGSGMNYDPYWHDVGIWEEVVPTLVKPAVEPDWSER